MNKFNIFDNTITTAKHKFPSWFSYPDDLQLEFEETASDDEINEIEQLLNIQLPTEYKYFLSHYSAGDFALSVIYSIKNDSDYNIIQINNQYPFDDFLLFSENGCGDFYGFKIEETKCQPQVYFYDHETQKWLTTKYNDFFEFIYDIALNIN